MSYEATRAEPSQSMSQLSPANHPGCPQRPHPSCQHHPSLSTTTTTLHHTSSMTPQHNINAPSLSMRIPLPQGNSDAPAPAATVCCIFCFYSFFHTSDSVALPSLYQAAGYKPCNSAKKRLSATAVQAVTNEQLHASRETGPACRK